MAFTPDPYLFTNAFGGGVKLGSGIADLFRQKQDRSRLQEIADQIRAGAFEDAGAGLVGMGQVAQGVNVAGIPYNRQQDATQQAFQREKFGANQDYRNRSFEADQAYRNAQLGIDRQRLAIAQQNASIPKAPDLETLYDPQTGLPYKAKWDPQTNEYVRVGGLKAPSNTSLSVGPDGTVQFNQGVGNKPLTEGQSKDTVFATRAAGSLPLINELGGALTNVGDAAMSTLPGGNLIRSEDYQRAEQAGLEFLQAILRKDTGAAITPAEQKEYGRVYLPQPGDTAKTLEQKRVSRERAVKALEAGMPPQAILARDKALGETEKPVSERRDLTPNQVPDGVDPQVWQFMTPEERALWQ